MARIRLYVDQPLGIGQQVTIGPEQGNYLFAVMRLAQGASVFLFNGVGGEWRAEVTAAGRRGGALVCVEQTAPLRLPPDLWLLFAPIKKARTDFIVEKAAELGVARILPVSTEFTNAERVRTDRLQAHAVEAAEQCGGTWVPEVCDLAPLARVLADWPANRQILWCNEHLSGARDALLRDGKRGPWAVLIGPEGGFSEAEQARLAAMPMVVQAGLGPRILRADTAAVAALTLWQSVLGDWG